LSVENEEGIPIGSFARANLRREDREVRESRYDSYGDIGAA
jgi:hypothetical protein